MKGTKYSWQGTVLGPYIIFRTCLIITYTCKTYLAINELSFKGDRFSANQFDILEAKQNPNRIKIALSVMEQVTQKG